VAVGEMLLEVEAQVDCGLPLDLLLRLVVR
jgi:hypothetical protein